mgnify:CR=1 FL=1
MDMLKIRCDTVRKLRRLAGEREEQGGRILLGGTVVMDTNAHAGKVKSTRRFRPVASRHTPGVRFHTHPLDHIPPSPADTQAISEEMAMRKDLLPASIVACRKGLYVMCLPREVVRLVRAFKEGHPYGFESDSACLEALYKHTAGLAIRRYRRAADRAFDIANSAGGNRQTKQQRYIKELRLRGVAVAFYEYKSVVPTACHTETPVCLPMACSREAYHLVVEDGRSAAGGGGRVSRLSHGPPTKRR